MNIRLIILMSALCVVRANALEIAQLVHAQDIAPSAIPLNNIENKRITEELHCASAVFPASVSEDCMFKCAAGCNRYFPQLGHIIAHLVGQHRYEKAKISGNCFFIRSGVVLRILKHHYEKREQYTFSTKKNGKHSKRKKRGPKNKQRDVEVSRPNLSRKLIIIDESQRYTA